MQQSDGYMKYIATRPRAERLGDHGLFGDEAVDLEQTMQELDQYNGNVWTHMPMVRACYDRWCRLQGEVESYYHDKPRERKKLSQEKEFRQIKNAVIQEAERIRLDEISFEDNDLAEHDEPEPTRGESNACRELWRIIVNEDISLDYRDRAAEKLEQVAERGDAHAQYRMGQLYRDGPLLIPDNHKAKHWLTQAAKQGLPEAQYALGKLLLSDDWEVRDTDKGIRWLKQAAENGNHFAAYRLGKEYLEETPSTRTPSERRIGLPNRRRLAISTPSTCWGNCT